MDGTFTGKENGIYMEGASEVHTTGGTFVGTGTNSAIKVTGSSYAYFKNSTIRSTGTYAVTNDAGDGGHCIIRSRASNFGITGGISGLVIATTNTSTGQASEKIRIYNSPTSIVFFPTWSDKDAQDDVQWYRTVKQGNYNETTVYKSNHNNETGRYVIHVYDSTDGTMSRNFIGAFDIFF